jgi:hypothetical protein
MTVLNLVKETFESKSQLLSGATAGQDTVLNL